MSSVAKQFNHSSVNLDSMYAKLTKAQDEFAHFFDQSSELQSVMANEVMSSSAVSEEEMEQELKELMEEDNNSDKLPFSTPSPTMVSMVPNAPLKVPIMQRAGAIQTPPPQNNIARMLESVRSKQNI